MTPKNLISLVFIAVLAASFRFINTPSFPPALNWDEVSLFYNSWSIFQTGKDEWSTPLPAIFRAFGDYKLPGYVYALVPLHVFGPNLDFTRFPSAAAGVLLVINIWLLVYKLTAKVSAAAFCAFITSVLPWSLFPSRVALEANLALTFFSLAITLSAFHRFHLSGLFFGLSALTYNSYRVLVPVFLGFLLFSRRRGSVPVTAVAFICFLPVIAQFVSGAGSARYRLVKIIDSGAIARIERLRNQSVLPQPLPALLFNRVTYFSLHAATNYLSHFSPNFLFIKGSANYQLNVQNHGLLYISLVPAILYGLLVVIRRGNYWVLVLLLIAPLAAALTRDAPHALRSSAMVLPLLLLIGFGITSKLLLPTLLVTLPLTINYFSLWPAYSSQYAPAWQYGYRQLAAYLNSTPPAKRVAITKKYGEPHIFLSAMLPIPPAQYQTDPNLLRYQKSDWFWVDRLHRYSFVNDWEMTEFAQRHGMTDWIYVTSPESRLPANLTKIISYPNGDPAFLIYE